MKIVEVKCIQENRVIGSLNNKNDGPLMIDALAFIRNWIPNNENYRFTKRPRLGDLLRCPKCNGNLTIYGSCSLNGEQLKDNPDSLIIGQFQIE